MVKDTNAEGDGIRQTQRRSVLTPEGQIEQAGRFARGLSNMDKRRKRLLLALLIAIFLPTLIVLFVSVIAWLSQRV